MSMTRKLSSVSVSFLLLYCLSTSWLFVQQPDGIGALSNGYAAPVVTNARIRQDSGSMISPSAPLMTAMPVSQGYFSVCLVLLDAAMDDFVIA